MSNTMTVPRRTINVEYAAPIENLSLTTFKVSSGQKSAILPRRSSVSAQFETLIIVLLLACFLFLGSLLFVYLAAFARIDVQNKEITALNDKIAAATDTRDSLVKTIASLTSEQHVLNSVHQMQMSLAGGNCEFVTPIPIPPQPERREVASAL